MKKKIYKIKMFFHKLLNNGWRKIETVKDFEKEHCFYELPKTNRYYHIVVDGKIQYNYYYGGCISSDKFVSQNVTHFIQIPYLKLPKKP